MKKVLLILLILILAGCLNLENKDSTPTPTPLIYEELDYTTLIPETDEIKDYIKENFIHYPTNILVDFPNNKIRWFCDNGIGINEDVWSDEDTKVWIENERAIYKGVLTQLDEGIYSSKGVFVPSMSTEKVVSESIDFYFIVRQNRATFIFEIMDLEELQELPFISYYYDYE